MEELNILEEKIDAAVTMIHELKEKNASLINEINDLRQRNIEMESSLSSKGNELKDRVNNIIGKIDKVIDN